eukprot:SAG31_NODE_43328_length_267_cov_1.202381_1_plen_48_part_10
MGSYPTAQNLDPEATVSTPLARVAYLELLLYRSCVESASSGSGSGSGS